jgi:hypothetical protein
MPPPTRKSYDVASEEQTVNERFFWRKLATQKPLSGLDWDTQAVWQES